MGVKIKPDSTKIPHDYLNHKGYTFERQQQDFEAVLIVLKQC